MDVQGWSFVHFWARGCALCRAGKEEAILGWKVAGTLCAMQKEQVLVGALLWALYMVTVLPEAIHLMPSPVQVFKKLRSGQWRCEELCTKAHLISFPLESLCKHDRAGIIMGWGGGMKYFSCERIEVFISIFTLSRRTVSCCWNFLSRVFLCVQRWCSLGNKLFWFCFLFAYLLHCFCVPQNY